MNSNCTKSSDLTNQIRPTPLKVTTKSFGPIGSKVYLQPHYLLKDEYFMKKKLLQLIKI